MKYEKLNINWNAEPNAPNLQIEKGENYVELVFDLNPFVFENIDEGDKGILEFQGVYKFYNGTMNDEGYHKGNHRFSNEVLPWGEFYELSNSDWINEFPKQGETPNDNVDNSDLKHYIFFLRDEEIECLAMDYFFHIEFKDEEIYSAKYPNQAFDHYLAMFRINQSNTTDENFANQIELFLDIEGDDEFKDLQIEVNQIIMNSDFKWFLKQAVNDQIPNINMKKLKAMMNSVVKYEL